jgi:hypothetical protein
LLPLDLIYITLEMLCQFLKVFAAYDNYCRRLLL